MEDSVMIGTHRRHDSCQGALNKGVFVEKFYEVWGEHNGIIGPGSHRSHSIESVYMCADCGSVYQPTQGNGLAESHEERFKLAKEILDTTVLVQLSRTLVVGEVFQQVSEKKYRQYEAVYLFQKGKLFRKQKNNSGVTRSTIILRDDPFESHPYILPKSGSFAELVWWQKYYTEKKPLPKSRKRELQASIKRDTKHKFKIPSASDKQLLATFDTAHAYVEQESMPLPTGSVKAVFVYLTGLPLELGNGFYIPEDVCEVVR